MFHAYGRDEGSKVSRLAQWEQVKKTTGIEPQKLKERPKLREECLYLWSLYIEIQKGSDSVGYLEIDAYKRLIGADLTPWQVSLMIEIDLIRRRHG